MIKNLQNIPLFQGLDEDVLKKLSSIITEQKFDEGEEIFKEGSLGDTLFIIEDGEVEIRKLINVEEGRYKALAIMFSGDFFGKWHSLIQSLVQHLLIV
jgi:CRP-like cAMP-binding protein